MNKIFFKYQYLAIITICLIAFAPIFKNDFINYDDPDYVLNNPYVKKINIENIKQLIIGKGIDLYLPLTMVSYSVDYFVNGSNPILFHFTNLILHIFNSLVLLFIFNKIIFKNDYIKYIIVLFFAINPLVTEIVCWIAQRKDMLYLLFYLLSINQYLNFEATKKNKYLILCFIFFVLSCLSKPMAISLPFIITLHVIFKSKKMILKNFVPFIAFYLVSIMFSVITIYRFKQLEVLKSASIPNYSFLENLITLFSEIGFYFFKPFLPINLSLFHMFPNSGEVLSNISLMLFSILGIGLTLWIGWLIKTKNNKPTIYLFLAWLVFLTPILQIIPNTHTYVSERYFYLSIVFPVAIVLYFIQNNIKTISNYKIIFICLTIIFTISTFSRSKVWKNTETLFEQELKLNPKNTIVLNNLAIYYNSKEKYDRAFPLFKKLIILEPSNEHYLSNYGITLSKLRQIDSAIVYLEKSLAINKQNYEAFSNLGICYIQNNLREKAFTCFLNAYKLNPDNAEIACNLGIYYFNSMEPDKALPLLEKAQNLGSPRALKYLNKLRNN
jgi:Tfp pilus assembly protein PilF